MSLEARIKNRLYKLNPFKKDYSSFGTNLIITGISRSGTSYLCNLIHRYNNCVILNEPGQLSGPIMEQQVPIGVADFYSLTRNKIMHGVPILNKLKNGEVTEDTAVHEFLNYYSPKVKDKNFVLGMKNNVAFLSHIERVRAVVPNSKVLVCVRNPYDTIASWKNSFDHLKNAEIEKRPAGHPEDPWLPEATRVKLREIAAEKNLAVKRARLWNHFAQRIIDQLHQDVILVRYPELVSDPHNFLEKHLHGLPLGDLRKPMQPSSPRSKASNLDEEDKAAIEKYCLESAGKLGV